MKVLIVRLSAIGDVIQGIPALVALKETFPSWQISWLVEETSAPLLANHPCLDRLFVLKRRWRKPGGSDQSAGEGLSSFFETLKLIRAAHFDVAVDLQGLFKSAFWARFSGAPRRIGHRHTREAVSLLYTETPGEHEEFDPAYPLVERYLDLVRALGADASKARFVLPDASEPVRRRVDDLLREAAGAAPYIALCPRSNWLTKDWPIARWTALAGKLQPMAPVLLIGDQKDELLLSELATAVEGVVNLSGRTSLPELAEIFRRCSCVIGGDTGPVHLANAVGGPRVVMIFGATSFRRSGPRGDGHTTVSRELSCQPCFERTCRFGHLNCVREISEEEVLKAVVPRLTGRSSR